MQDKTERWLELCNQVAVEQDPQKLKCGRKQMRKKALTLSVIEQLVDKLDPDLKQIGRGGSVHRRGWYMRSRGTNPVMGCKANTKAGKPCPAAPTRSGYCNIHSQVGNAAELGRIGDDKLRWIEQRFPKARFLTGHLSDQ